MIKFSLFKLSILFIVLSATVLAQTYYVTTTGKKLHTQSCRFVDASSKSIELKDAIQKGYEPCGVCDPGGQSLSEAYYNWKSQQDSVKGKSSKNENVENKRCKGITQKGKQCKRNAQKDSDYCWQHSK